MHKEIEKAVTVLRAGGVILYPTDTIWGVGCDATNAEAVEKVYRIKKREPDKSMLILVGDLFMAERYVADIPEAAVQLFEVADKPLTLILDGAVHLAENLPASDGSIGIRIPDDDFCRELLRQFRKPLVSTSANFTGQPSPADFKEISEELKNAVDLVIDWRQEEQTTGKASSVIKIGRGGQIRILRQ